MTFEVLTMCDRGFLPQTLLLARSLAEHTPDVRLSVLVTDEGCDALRELPWVTVFDQTTLLARHPELLALRRRRSHREFCWTLTPAFCQLRLEAAPEGAALTWVDADIRFFGSARALTRELGAGSLLLVPHRYWRPYPTSAPPDYLAERYGEYNGGTVVFRNDDVGRRAIGHWVRETFAWCHDRVESGRYGNQRYLEDLAGLDGVRIAGTPGIGLAPWNAGPHRIAGSPAAPTVDGQPVIFYHYQSLRLHRRLPLLPAAGYPTSYLFDDSAPAVVGRTNAWFRLTSDQRELLWKPYLRDLVSEAQSLGCGRGRAPRRELWEDFTIRSELAVGRCRASARTLHARAAGLRPALGARRSGRV